MKTFSYCITLWAPFTTTTPLVSWSDPWQEVDRFMGHWHRTGCSCSFSTTNSEAFFILPSWSVMKCGTLTDQFVVPLEITGRLWGVIETFWLFTMSHKLSTTNSTSILWQSGRLKTTRTSWTCSQPGRGTARTKCSFRSERKKTRFSRTRRSVPSLCALIVVVTRGVLCVCVGVMSPNV